MDNNKLEQLQDKALLSQIEQFNKIKSTSKDVVSDILAEDDINKADELIEIFNFNQKKKDIARIEALSNFTDLIIDKTMERFSSRSDEITTQESIQALKAVSDALDKSRQRVSATADNTPLIQINQQNNDVSIGDSDVHLANKESRDRVKSFVEQVLQAAKSKNNDDELVEVDNNDN